MKQIALYFILLIGSNSFSQETVEDEKLFESKPISFGFNFAPELASRMLTSADGSESSKDVIKLFNEEQTGKFGFTGGMNILGKINDLLSFETGLHYSNKGFAIKEFGLIYSNPQPDDPTSYRANFSFHYLEIPTKLIFNINKTKTHYFFSAGLATSFLLKSSSTQIYSYSDGSTDRNNTPVYGEFKKLSLSPSLSLGVDFSLNEKTSFRIEPIFRYGILPIFKSDIANTSMWSAGINFCYYIKL